MAADDKSENVVVIFRSGQRIKIGAPKGANHLVGLICEHLRQGQYSVSNYFRDGGVMLCTSDINFIGPESALLD